MEGEGQYVGDKAAEWFSKYMNKPGFKMYKLSRPRVIREHEEWSDIGEAGDKVIESAWKPYGYFVNTPPTGTHPFPCSFSLVLYFFVLVP